MLVRLVQQARKDADLDITDRIAATLTLPQDMAEAVRTHHDLVAEQVLALQLDVVVGDGEPSATVSVVAQK